MGGFGQSLSKAQFVVELVLNDAWLVDWTIAHRHSVEELANCTPVHHTAPVKTEEGHRATGVIVFENRLDGRIVRCERRHWLWVTIPCSNTVAFDRLERRRARRTSAHRQRDHHDVGPHGSTMPVMAGRGAEGEQVRFAYSSQLHHQSMRSCGQALVLCRREHGDTLKRLCTLVGSVVLVAACASRDGAAAADYPDFSDDPVVQQRLESLEPAFQGPAHEPGQESGFWAWDLHTQTEVMLQFVEPISFEPTKVHARTASYEGLDPVEIGRAIWEQLTFSGYSVSLSRCAERSGGGVSFEAVFDDGVLGILVDARIGNEVEMSVHPSEFGNALPVMLSREEMLEQVARLRNADGTLTKGVDPSCRILGVSNS